MPTYITPFQENALSGTLFDPCAPCCSGVSNCPPCGKCKNYPIQWQYTGTQFGGSCALFNTMAILQLTNGCNWQASVGGLTSCIGKTANATAKVIAKNGSCLPAVPIGTTFALGGNIGGVLSGCDNSSTLCITAKCSQVDNLCQNLQAALDNDIPTFINSSSCLIDAGNRTYKVTYNLNVNTNRFPNQCNGTVTVEITGGYTGASTTGGLISLTFNGVWELTLTLSGDNTKIVYRTSDNDWNCCGSNTLTLFSNDTGCSAPNTITIDPLDCNACPTPAACSPCNICFTDKYPDSWTLTATGFADSQNCRGSMFNGVWNLKGDLSANADCSFINDNKTIKLFYDGTANFILEFAAIGTCQALQYSLPFSSWQCCDSNTLQRQGNPGYASPNSLTVVPNDCNCQCLPVNCGPCPAAPQIWNATIAGLGGSTDCKCSIFNGTWPLTFVDDPSGDCTYEYIIDLNHKVILFFESTTQSFQLDLITLNNQGQCPSIVYALSRDLFKCCQSNIMPLAGGPTSYPAQCGPSTSITGCDPVIFGGKVYTQLSGLTQAIIADNPPQNPGVGDDAFCAFIFYTDFLNYQCCVKIATDTNPFGIDGSQRCTCQIQIPAGSWALCGTDNSSACVICTVNQARLVAQALQQTYAPNSTCTNSTSAIVSPATKCDCKKPVLIPGCPACSACSNGAPRYVPAVTFYAETWLLTSIGFNDVGTCKGTRYNGGWLLVADPTSLEDCAYVNATGQIHMFFSKDFGAFIITFESSGCNTLTYLQGPTFNCCGSNDFSLFEGSQPGWVVPQSINIVPGSSSACQCQGACPDKPLECAPCPFNPPAWTVTLTNLGLGVFCDCSDFNGTWVLTSVNSGDGAITCLWRKKIDDDHDIQLEFDPAGFMVLTCIFTGTPQNVISLECPAIKYKVAVSKWNCCDTNQMEFAGEAIDGFRPEYGYFLNCSTNGGPVCTPFDKTTNLPLWNQLKAAAQLAIANNPPKIGEGNCSVVQITADLACCVVAVLITDTLLPGIQWPVTDDLCLTDSQVNPVLDALQLILDPTGKSCSKPDPAFLVPSTVNCICEGEVVPQIPLSPCPSCDGCSGGNYLHPFNVVPSGIGLGGNYPSIWRITANGFANGGGSTTSLFNGVWDLKARVPPGLGANPYPFKDCYYEKDIDKTHYIRFYHDNFIDGWEVDFVEENFPQARYIPANPAEPSLGNLIPFFCQKKNIFGKFTGPVPYTLPPSINVDPLNFSCKPARCDRNTEYEANCMPDRCTICNYSPPMYSVKIAGLPGGPPCNCEKFNGTWLLAKTHPSSEDCQFALAIDNERSILLYYELPHARMQLELRRAGCNPIIYFLSKTGWSCCGTTKVPYVRGAQGCGKLVDISCSPVLPGDENWNNLIDVTNATLALNPNPPNTNTPTCAYTFFSNTDKCCVQQASPTGCNCDNAEVAAGTYWLIPCQEGLTRDQANAIRTALQLEYSPNAVCVQQVDGQSICKDLNRIPFLTAKVIDTPGIAVGCPNFNTTLQLNNQNIDFPPSKFSGCLFCADTASASSYPGLCVLFDCSPDDGDICSSVSAVIATTDNFDSYTIPGTVTFCEENELIINFLFDLEPQNVSIFCKDDNASSSCQGNLTLELRGGGSDGDSEGTPILTYSIQPALIKPGTVGCTCHWPACPNMFCEFGVERQDLGQQCCCNDCKDISPEAIAGKCFCQQRYFRLSVGGFASSEECKYCADANGDYVVCNWDYKPQNDAHAHGGQLRRSINADGQQVVQLQFTIAKCGPGTPYGTDTCAVYIYETLLKDFNCTAGNSFNYVSSTGSACIRRPDSLSIAPMSNGGANAQVCSCMGCDNCMSLTLTLSVDNGPTLEVKFDGTGWSGQFTAVFDGGSWTSGGNPVDFPINYGGTPSAGASINWFFEVDCEIRPCDNNGSARMFATRAPCGGSIGTSSDNCSNSTFFNCEPFTARFDNANNGCGLDSTWGGASIS